MQLYRLSVSVENDNKTYIVHEAALASWRE